MIDVAEHRGLQFNLARLRQQLGVPIIVMQANQRRGVPDLKRALVGLVGSTPKRPDSPFPRPFQDEVARLGNLLATRAARPLPAYLVERLLLDSSGYLSDSLLNGQAERDRPGAGRGPRPAGRGRLPGAGGRGHVAAMPGWPKPCSGVITRPAQRVVTRGDRIDRILTHRVWGTAIFALLMLFVFSSIFKWAEPVMNLVDAGIHRPGPVRRRADESRGACGRCWSTA